MGGAVAAAAPFVLESGVPFGRSRIWELQTDFFVSRGPEAFRRDGVPSYVTSNPVMAECYSRLIAAWMDRLDPNSGAPAILELGAGSGALAYRLVSRLAREGRRFKYVMSDIAGANLRSWEAHPFLGSFVDRGLVDFALVDVRRPGSIKLRVSGEELRHETPLPGLAVIGNYLLDTIPQDLFFVRGGELFEALGTLSCDVDPGGLPPEQLLDHLSFTFAHRKLDPRPYGDPLCDEILESYRSSLDESYVLLPAVALRALDTLRSLAGGRLLCLFGDKGRWFGRPVDGSGPPAIVHHGSFSVEVNFHALASHCALCGGAGYLPERAQPGIAVVCLDYRAGAGAVEALQREYRVVGGSRPQEAFDAIRSAVSRIPEATMGELCEVVRASRFDPLPFQMMLPRLRELAPEMPPGARAELAEVMAGVWEEYFPTGLAGEADLGLELGVLSHLIEDDERAAGYLARSIELFGPSPGTLFHLAQCQERLGNAEEARHTAQQLVDMDPMNPAARALLLRCMAMAPDSHSP